MADKQKTNPEPVLWFLFGAGGMVAAFFVPIHIFIFGLGYPLGLLPAESFRYENVSAVFGNPLFKLYLMVFLTVPLFHAAHRVRFTVLDVFRLHKIDTVLAVVLYGGAAVLSLVGLVAAISA